MILYSKNELKSGIGNALKPGIGNALKSGIQQSGIEHFL
jgi:hypothetical protein